MSDNKDYVLILRSCKVDGSSYNGFKWPESGEVSCPDWKPEPKCGNGLHGLMWGRGDWSLLNRDNDARWQVVKVAAADVVKIDESKVKFPRGEVVYTGKLADAVAMVLADKWHIDKVIESATAEAEKAKTLNPTAASSGYGSTAASSGYGSTAASSGYGSTAASSGENTVAMAAGTNCIVSAGSKGCFASAYWDEKEERYKILVAYVGQDGIKPGHQIHHPQWKVCRGLMPEPKTIRHWTERGYSFARHGDCPAIRWSFGNTGRRRSCSIRKPMKLTFPNAPRRKSTASSCR